MPQISTVKYSDIQEAKRYDAEYFKPDTLKLVSLIESRNYIKIGESFDVTKLAGFEYTKYFTKQNMESENVYPALTSLNIQNEDLVEENSLYIDKEIADNFLSRSKLFFGDVVLSYTGEYRRSLAILKEGFQLGPNICLIRKKTEKINPFYLSTYLNSEIGQTLLDREKTLSGQPTIAMSRIRTIVIPVLQKSLQDEIEKIVINTNNKRNQSKELYKEAEELLWKELGLLDYRPKHSLFFETTIKDIKEARRFDSEYFQPKYIEVIERIKGYKKGYSVAGDIVKWKKGIEVGTGAYVEKGRDFVRVSDFSTFGIEESSKKISEELFNKIKDDFQPKKGEILFTKDGTIGITYVLEEDINGILSGAFLRLYLKRNYLDLSKEYLSLFFNSILSQLQIKQLSGGALIAHLKPSDFEKIKIPLVDTKIQKQISEKIKKSFELRKESKELLEKAKKMVEDEIEK